MFIVLDEKNWGINRYYEKYLLLHSKKPRYEKLKDVVRMPTRALTLKEIKKEADDLETNVKGYLKTVEADKDRILLAENSTNNSAIFINTKFIKGAKRITIFDFSFGMFEANVYNREKRRYRHAFSVDADLYEGGKCKHSFAENAYLYGDASTSLANLLLLLNETSTIMFDEETAVELLTLSNLYLKYFSGDKPEPDQTMSNPLMSPIGLYPSLSADELQSIDIGLPFSNSIELITYLVWVDFLIANKIKNKPATSSTYHTEKEMSKGQGA